MRTHKQASSHFYSETRSRDTADNFTLGADFDTLSPASDKYHHPKCKQRPQRRQRQRQRQRQRHPYKSRMLTDPIQPSILVWCLQKWVFFFFVAKQPRDLIDQGIINFCATMLKTFDPDFMSQHRHTANSSLSFYPAQDVESVKRIC